MSKKFTINTLYPKDMLDFQSKRYADALASYKELFGGENHRFFSSCGRTEIGGNHTDHNNGRVLAGGVSLDVIAVVEPVADNVITIKSEGFDMDTVSISHLEPIIDEQNSSSALIRGVAAGFSIRGHKIGGFRAYTTSNVLKGSGLSSSAAFEVLVGTILNTLYNNNEISAVEIAQIAQYSENVFFGKPSGLMDQMASSVGGFITIDFKDTKNPVIEKIDFDFAKSGHALCIVDTKGDHADLTPDYAAIPAEMKSVAQFFGKSVLREISREDVLENLTAIREKTGDRAVLRALHFYDDNDRAKLEAKALNDGNFEEFLELINQSGDSSYKYLQNLYSNSDYKAQGLGLALYLAESVLKGEGAARVHGGGFAGTIQAFVPNGKIDEFKSTMNNAFGDGSCYVLEVRPVGGVEVSI